jgi:hypothetical protein
LIHNLQFLFRGRDIVSIVKDIQKIIRAQNGLYRGKTSYIPEKKARPIVVVAKSNIIPPKTNRKGNFHDSNPFINFTV